MSQAALIINVSDQPQVHSNGLSGTWHVLPKKSNEEFSLLVVYPTPEIQDIGDGRRISHWLKALPLAKDIVGYRSDAAAHGFGSPGTKEKWGLMLCKAEPDLPKELLNAIEEEIEYLNNHRPKVEMYKDEETKAVVAENIYRPGVAEQLQKNSDRVRKLRAAFENDCRSLVTKGEIQKAKKNLQIEDQRMVSEGDRMWASVKEKDNINELHRASCTRLGQERPWNYIPQQLTDCPGCGAKIKENILSCPHCAGWLEEGIETLRAMPPKERARTMYPEKYDSEPVTVGGDGGRRKAK